VAIGGALKFNTTLERLDLSSNRIGDEGAMALLKSLKEINCSLMWLNLEDNAKISPGLQKDFDFVLASRQVLKSFWKFLRKPLDKKLMPLVIHSVRQNYGYRQTLEPAQCQETGAGPIFVIVRGATIKQPNDDGRGKARGEPNWIFWEEEQ
jgi:Leucine Rich repeat